MRATIRWNVFYRGDRGVARSLICDEGPWPAGRLAGWLAGCGVLNCFSRNEWPAQSIGRTRGGRESACCPAGVSRVGRFGQPRLLCCDCGSKRLPSSRTAREGTISRVAGAMSDTCPPAEVPAAPTRTYVAMHGCFLVQERSSPHSFEKESELRQCVCVCVSGCWRHWGNWCGKLGRMHVTNAGGPACGAYSAHVWMDMYVSGRYLL